MKNQIKAIILIRLLKVFILCSARPKANSIKYTIPAGTEANKPKTATKPTAPDAELPSILGYQKHSGQKDYHPIKDTNTN